MQEQIKANGHNFVLVGNTAVWFGADVPFNNPADYGLIAKYRPPKILILNK